MDRRRFLVTSGLTLAGTASVSGCLGLFGGQTPPPRKSSVIADVTATDNGIVMKLPDQPWIQSRADVGNSDALAPPDADALASLSPVGVAAAAKGGPVGATGRGSGGYRTAPRTHYGYAKWHGDDDDYDGWRENHADDVQKYDAAIAAIGIAYLGTNAQYSDDAPGPGKPPGGWDETKSSIDGSNVTYQTDLRDGWYRSGAHLQAAGADHDFGWEAIDYKVEQASSDPTVDRVWKVSPRL